MTPTITANDLLSTDVDVLDDMPLERLEAEISTFAGRLASAREHVRVAHALDEYTLIREAFVAGTISYSKVRAITRVVVTENEEDLVQLALDGTASQVERTCAGMRRSDRNETQDAKDAAGLSNVKITYNGDGTATTSITAPLVDAKKAHAALLKRADMVIGDAKMEGETNTDTIDRLGGLGRIHAETACALLDGTIDLVDMPPVEMMLNIDDDTLGGNPAESDRVYEGVCTFDHDRISPLVARRLACDARLQLAVQDSVGDALGIGRESKPRVDVWRPQATNSVRERSERHVPFPWM